MRLDTVDTIAAVASAAGVAARGIVRISGAEAVACLARFFRSSTNLQAIRSARSIEGKLQLDEPLGLIPCRALIWPDQCSYTRQSSVELHLIGSAPIVDAVLEKVCAAGARMAEPGEFTLRAFLAGRLDLTQAEAVLGVIQATSTDQLASSLWQLAGGLAGPLNQTRDQLLDLLAHLEAGLDFVEEDIEFITTDDLSRQLNAVRSELEAIQDQLEQRHEHHHLPRVVLRGAPNVGKSSLLNALLGSDQAIVSNQAGTTRDYVSGRLEIEGMECLLIDTAGQQEPTTNQKASEIHEAAQQVTTRQSGQAQLELLCLDGTQQPDEELQSQIGRDDPRRLIVITKADQPQQLLVSGHLTSSKTGSGIAELRSAIHDRLRVDQSGQVVAGTAARCHDSLRLALDSIQQALTAVHQSLGEELVAAELRVALQQLGRVVGTVYTDDVLDRIFSRFCIGK